MATEVDCSQKSEAQEYDNFMNEVEAQHLKGLNILDHLKFPLEGCKVVDLGCGTGDYTYRLAESVGPNGRVIGVDPDGERIKIASKKWIRENLSFVVGDGKNYPKNQYDLIFSHYALHWVENKQAVFQNAFKTLRSGGHFVFVSAVGTSAIGEELSALMGPVEHQAINSLWHFVSVEDYREIATSVGFKVDWIEEELDSYILPSVDVLLDSWYGITNSRFNVSKANPLELEKFKQKYDGRKPEMKPPVAKIILTKN